MSFKSRTLRRSLLIGASLGSLMIAAAAAGQSGQSGGRISGGRGGGNAADAAVRAAQAQGAQAARTNSASQRAIASFRRAAATRAAMQDAQRAARAAALSAQASVPNGLGKGGLEVANGVKLDPSLWTGAKDPTQATGSDGRTKVTIDQTEQKAILTWDSFNIGRETDLAFNQGGTDWVALNRVTGASADPTQILGTIKAPGSVYILNQNGVIFGGSSQVNVRSLVASTANISNDQFLNRGIYSQLSGTNYLAAFTDAKGAVKVEAGAQIVTNTPASVTSGGGFVLLMGTQVINEGTILTPRGQAALVAGDDFILRRGYGTEENKYSTTRGNEVRGLIDAGSTSGTVTNAGLIEASEGDVTLAGRTIRQDGVALATTSVNQRGTIHLLNSASDTRGSVTLGANSLTTILPELDSKATALNGQRDALIKESETANTNRATTITGGFDDRSLLADRLDQSRVEIVTGGNVLFEGGSQTIARGGQVAVQANAGRITVADGARIDVSGVMGVALDMSSNVIKINVQGNELRDSAANRDEAALKSQDVWVDVRDLILLPSGTGGYEGDRYYTPGGLLEVGGQITNMAHGIGEWAAIGGTITLSAKEIVAEQGSEFDLSGGSLDYAAGYVRSTRVMGADGKMYDIRNAPAWLKILGVGNAYGRTHARWGEQYTQVYSHPLFTRGTSNRWEDGYSVGRDAGKLILSAPTVLFEGDIVAETLNGAKQVNGRADGITDGYKVGQHSYAQGGQLILGRYGFYSSAQGLFDVDVKVGEVADLTPDLETDAAIAEDRIGTAWFDADRLNAARLGGLTLQTRGAIAIESDLTLADGGSVSLVAPTIDIAASITARSGSIRATNWFAGGVDQGASAYMLQGGTSQITLREGATLDVRGLWVNTAQNAADSNKLGLIDGGSVSLSSSRDVTTEAGSRIDASSGAALLELGETRGGIGGDVSLIADMEPTQAGDGILTLGGQIAGFGVAGGGTLTLKSGNSVLIGGTGLATEGTLKAGEAIDAGLILDESYLVGAGETLPTSVTLTRMEVLTYRPGETIDRSIAVTTSNPVTVASAWVIPTGFVGSAGIRASNGTIYRAGNTVPAGTTLVGGTINPGVAVPANFTQGVSTGSIAIPHVYAAGTAAPQSITLAVGTVIDPGAVLARDVAVKPVTQLGTDLFQTGFADYRVTGAAGLAVAQGTKLEAVRPVMRIAAGAASLATGADPAAALERWDQPLQMEDPLSGVLTQRAGANLTLQAGDGAHATATLLIGKGAALSVDPGHIIALLSEGQLTVEGALTARGGAITLDQYRLVPALTQPIDAAPHSRSIWIGETAVLDVSGQAFTATDAQGRSYGRVLDGGLIRVGGVIDLTSGTATAGDLFVVVRDGAVLDASGTRATLDLMGRGATDVASNGGTIAFASLNGMDLGGTWRAQAGGQGAAAGTLSVALETPLYSTNNAATLRARELVITQVAKGSVLADDAAPGAAMVYGNAAIGVDQIAAGGFGSVNLFSHGNLSFEGDVTLSAAQSLSLSAIAIGLSEASAANARITLEAPTVLLAGVPQRGSDNAFIPAVPNANPSTRTSDATFTVNADLIDVRRQVRFGLNGRQIQGANFGIDRRGFGLVELMSRGDLRIGAVGAEALLQTRQDMILGAARIYPGVGGSGRVRAGMIDSVGYDADYGLRIVNTGTGPVAAPLSVFGSLNFESANIEQGGRIFVPLGTISMGYYSGSTITLLPGSLTSTSAKGLVIPYGGTADGIKWFVGGVELKPEGLLGRGVTFTGDRVDVQQGATIDLSGGGDVLGAGFISGRGGSIDTLLHPLALANPGYGMSAGGSSVYAIVPGQSGYAPADANSAAPMLGQQITFDKPVGGLPAGTYTLMPASYALLPGAFRVEIAASADPRGISASAQLPDGSFVAGGRLGVANTGLLESLSRQVIVSPAAVARTYSLYNETNYAAFVASDAARIGVPRGMQPRDAQNLNLALTPGAGGDAFNFDGTIDFRPADEAGFGGTASVYSSGTTTEFEVLASGAAPSEGFTGISLYADDLNALRAGRLVLGGRPQVTYGQQGNYMSFVQSTTVPARAITLREGAILRGAEVLLVSGYNPFGTTTTGTITVEAGAGISTLGMGASPFDASDGFVYNLAFPGSGGAGMLAVSNGNLRVLNAPSTQPQPSILIGVCGASGNCDADATLYSEGTIAFATTNRFELGNNVRYGTRNLLLSVGAVNIGSGEALADAEAAGLLPSGLVLNQAVLDRLLQGDTSTGAPALESLTLNASEAINTFGTVTLDTYDASGKSRIANLIFGTPALYGFGGTGDVATIRTQNLIWSGTTGAPGAVITGGAGTGSGSLVIDAQRIAFGYGAEVLITGQENAQRLALGFANVTLNASDRITATDKGAVAFYQSQGAYDPVTGYAYSGGNLTINAPLLTGEAGSSNAITAGGAITVTAPAGSKPAAITGKESLGAELTLKGDSISLASAVVLPSGKLTLSATNDITLADAAKLDLSGREVLFDDVKKYSWGGEVILESRAGDVRQAAGSVIDLSAKNNHAGRITVSALGANAGVVDLLGDILGTSSGEYDAGGTIMPYRAGFIDLRAQHLGDSGTLSEQFADLNTRLTETGMTGGRGFQLKQGDLTIGNAVKAGEVNISLDGGALTVTGTIDASGAEVGVIRLAARDGLTVAGTAVLDAHGTALRVDSYGKIIDSPNRAIVELNSGNGLLTLGSGARIDLRHGTGATGATGGDGVARGTLELNAPRLGGATAGDIAIDASGSLNIQGARSIAVNAVQRYDDAAYGTGPAASGRPYQVITQAYLDAKHAESVTFLGNALANGTLLNGKLAGLNNATYRDAFHLRPGVEIVSATPDGDLVVSGDVDLSGYRYASLNPNFQHSDVLGSGEVGALTIRAGGNLDIYGSITDGFADPGATPDDNGWLLRPGNLSYGSDVVVPSGNVTLADGTTYPAGRAVNYDLPVKAMSVPAGTRLPAQAVLGASTTLPANTILSGDIRAADGTLLHAVGTRLAEAVTLPAGTRLGAGFVATGPLSLRAMVWPKGVALPATATIDGNITLPLGGLIPSQANLKLPAGAISVNLRPVGVGGAQGTNWAVAGLLPEGSQSWSMRFVAGADLAAADTRLTTPRDAEGNLTLSDTHFSVFATREFIPGTPDQPGGAYFWSEQAAIDLGVEAGTQVTDDWDPVNTCRDVPEWCGLYTHAVTEQAVTDFGLDIYWADYGFTAPVKPGDPLPAEVVEWLCFDPIYCTSLGEPIPGTPPSYGDIIDVNPANPIFSVVRTGTGDLDLIAGGNIAMRSSYGVYTAGTQSKGVTATFNQARPIGSDGTVLGAKVPEGYEELVTGDAALYQAWYPELGGNVLLRTGGDLSGDAWTSGGLLGADGNRAFQKTSSDPANWLWRQGDVAGDANGAAWWINFGTYVPGQAFPTANSVEEMPYLVGFTGYGTLGGGNLQVEVGGDAGTVDALSFGRWQNGTFPRSQALVLAVGSTGRVGADGTLTLTGGGDLDLRIGGTLNPERAGYIASAPSTSADYLNVGLSGMIANLRGHAEIGAAAQGSIDLRYGPFVSSQDPKEVRAYDPFTSTWAIAAGGVMLMPGDATFVLTARDDLVLSGVRDGGRAVAIDNNGTGIDPAWFTLWTDRTAIDLFAAGGNLTPTTQMNQVGSAQDPGSTDLRFVYPAILRAAAPSGSVYLGASAGRQQEKLLGTSLMLAPSPNGQLEILAGNSIYAGGYAVTRSSADPAVLATPFNPATLETMSPLVNPDRNALFAFGPNTASGLHDLDPARFYAVGGDIIGLRTGEIVSGFYAPALLGRTMYEAGGPVWMKAGRDIVNSGLNIGETQLIEQSAIGGQVSGGNLIVHTNPLDVSIVSAGRDILYSSFVVAGPGSFEMTAGRNILMEDRAAVTSIGAIVPGDTRPGASIAMMAGMTGVEWAKIRERYLDPSLVLVPNPDGQIPPLEGSGKVAKAYNKELGTWLEERYGFTGSDSEALAYFDGLAPEQQRIFLRQIYYAETREGGREYNDPDSSRFASYLRGREMIATLFPDKDAGGAEITRTGDIILFGGAGVRTNFGGDIELMAPGGQVVIGVQGLVPPSTAGLVTQGQGDIRIFSEQSLLLGLSRIMTTFGGDIFAWSEEGDINAGRGAKTSVVYTPPRIVYDAHGNVTLAPQVPSTGAGIATLNPVPEVAPGDVDLIAPLGTIDAGEAGIRVSGNINLAALRVLNAANIQVQGTSRGIPQAVVVNTGALNAASSATAAVTVEANRLAERSRPIARDIPSIVTVTFAGFGEE